MALLECQQGSGIPSGGSIRVGWPSMGAEVLSRWVGRCRRIFPEGREGSGGHPGGLVGVGSPYWRTDRGREAIPEVWEGSGGPPGGRKTITEGV